jgi:hypothetical protein
MKMLKMSLILVFLLSMIVMPKISNAQENLAPVGSESVTGTEWSTESETSIIKETKKDKKKDKKAKKETIQITDSFYWSLLINLVAVLILIVGIYYPNYRKQEVFFTYFLFNISIFLLTFLLNEVKISLGAAFGLFAVFSMLRYRTEGISMKDMTYLFIVIAMGLIAAVKLENTELMIIDGIILVTTFILEGNILLKREHSKRIRYENIELIKPENQNELISDLEKRTGLIIHKINIKKIDFLKDIASIEVFYYPQKSK